MLYFNETGKIVDLNNKSQINTYLNIHAACPNNICGLYVTREHELFKNIYLK